MKKIIILSIAFILGSISASLYHSAQEFEKEEVAFKKHNVYVKRLHDDANFMNEKVKEGDATAIFYLGMKYLNGEGVDKNISKGMKLLEPLAEKNDINAQETLASYYQLEDSVKDYSKAFYWSSICAHRGSPICQLRLAKMYADGLGIKTNQNLALFWQKKFNEKKVRTID